MKVVSQGPVKTKRVVCHNCCYELEYTGEDVHGFIDSDGDSFQHIFCPREECKSPFRGRGRTQITVKWP